METKETKTLELKIFGNTIKIVTDEEEEYVFRVVSYLNKKMEDISRNLKIASNVERMTLVALSIADEYHKIKEGTDGIVPSDANIDNIISMIDNALSSDI